MDQTSATTPPAVAAPAQSESQPLDVPTPDGASGFAARGRVRRRARYLRKARELAYRDLGGLVFSLHRFGQRNDALVLAKLSTLSRFDAELRALEDALKEHVTVTVLREAGITACPRCAAIHSSEDRFCPNCGLHIGHDLALANASDATASASAAGTPPAAQTPSAGGQTPSAGGQTPSAGGQTPSAGGQTPGAGGQTPGAGGPAVAGRQAPGTGAHAVPAEEVQATDTDAAAATGPPSPRPSPSGTPGASGGPSPERATPAPAAPGVAANEEEPTEIVRPPATGR